MRLGRFQPLVYGWLTMVGVLLLLAPSLGYAVDETIWLRYQNVPNHEVLQSAVRSYTGPHGEKVDLIAAVHVGDRAYYANLQRRFEGYQKLLFELVKPADMDVRLEGPDGQGARRRDHDESRLSSAQRVLKDLLGLEFQLDHIDYRRRNFVHADISSDAMLAEVTQNWPAVLQQLIGWSLLDGARMRYSDGSLRLGSFDLLRAWMAPDRPRALKKVLAHELADMGGALEDFSGPGGNSVLIGQRNAIALGVLKKTLASGSQRVAIFFGGAHMPDMEKRLIAMGFTRSGEQWLTAWQIGR